MSEDALVVALQDPIGFLRERGWTRTRKPGDGWYEKRSEGRFDSARGEIAFARELQRMLGHALPASWEGP